MRDVRNYYAAVSYQVPTTVVPHVGICCLEPMIWKQYNKHKTQESPLLGTFNRGLEANEFLNTRRREQGTITIMQAMENLGLDGHRLVFSQSNGIKAATTREISTGRRHTKVPYHDGRLKRGVSKSMEGIHSALGRRWRRFRFWCETIKDDPNSKNGFEDTKNGFEDTKKRSRDGVLSSLEMALG